jgi:hypothetical protein
MHARLVLSERDDTASVSSITRLDGGDFYHHLPPCLSCSISDDGCLLATVHSGMKGIFIWRMFYDGNAELWWRKKVPQKKNNVSSTDVEKRDFVFVRSKFEGEEEAIRPYNPSLSLNPLQPFVLTMSSLPHTFVRSFLYSPSLASQRSVRNISLVVDPTTTAPARASTLFFLPTIPGLVPQFAPLPASSSSGKESGVLASNKSVTATSSRILRNAVVSRSRFSILLGECVRDFFSSSSSLSSELNVSSQRCTSFLPLLMYCHSQSPSSLHSQLQTLSLIPPPTPSSSEVGDDSSNNDIMNMIICLSVCIESGIECDLIQALLNVFITQQKENILSLIEEEKADGSEEKMIKSKNLNRQKKAFIYSFEDLLDLSVEKWKKMEEMFQTGISILSLFTNTPV